MLNKATIKYKVECIKMRYKLLFRRILSRRMVTGLNRYSCRFFHYPNIVVKVLRILTIPLAIIKTTKYTFPYAEMDITSKCSLNCKECSHLIPYHKDKGNYRHYDIDGLLENVDLFINKIDNCYMFRLLGGEPLLHPQLHQLINHLVAQEKIKHIQILTNGTIMPQGKHLSSLKHKKVSVNISNYGALSSKSNELVRLFKSNGIRYFTNPHVGAWRKTGGLVPRGYTFEEMKHVFYNCGEPSCKTIYNQKLWLCPTAMHGMELGLVENNDSEFIDLKDCTKEEFWKKLDEMEIPDNFTTCFNCLFGSVATAEFVPCAEQV